MATRRATPGDVQDLVSQIPFTDEAQPPVPETDAQKAKASAKANDEAAKRALENLKINRPKDTRVVVKPLPAPEAAKKAPARFRVLERAEVTRGASRFILQAGKEIDANQYDIAELQSRGVKLKALDAPQPQPAA